MTDPPPPPPAWALPGEVRGIGAPLEKYRAAAESRAAWPTQWPDGMRDPNHRVWRADVFDVADAWRVGTAGAAALVTAVCVWGHGRNGYGPWRTEQTLSAPDLNDRLEALDPLRSPEWSRAELVAAYQAFNNRRTGLAQFRAPFFTKLLYFAAYRRGAAGVQPLILDSVVASRLPDDIGVRKPVRRGTSPAWTSAEYLRYCDWAREQSDPEPDEVEMRLFTLGPAT